MVNTSASSDGLLDLKAFYKARTLYVFTEQLIGISIPIIIYTETNDAALAALSFFAIWVPRCLFPFVAAHVIDASPPRLQMRALDILRGATLLTLIVLPVGVWLLVGAGLLSLLNLWMIALFEKGLSAAAPGGSASQDQTAIETFSTALRADRLALIISAIVSGSLLSTENETLLILIAVAVLIVAHWFQARSGILRFRVVPDGTDRTTVRQTMRALFGNVTICRLIVLLWVLNLLQGMVFSALPVIAVDGFGSDATAAASIFAALHIGSWCVLRTYPNIASWIARGPRLTFTMVCFSASLVAAFLTSSYFIFIAAVCISLSIRNTLDVEVIIERNRHIPHASFGRSMAVFLPLIYLPFALAGLLVTGIFRVGGLPLLEPAMAVGAIGAFALWWFSLHKAFTRDY